MEIVELASSDSSILSSYWFESFKSTSQSKYQIYSKLCKDRIWIKIADIGPKLVLQSGRSPRISHQAKQISNLPFKYYWPTCEEEFNLLLFDRKQVPIIDILEGQFNDNSFVLNSYSWPTGFNCGSPPFKWTSENYSPSQIKTLILRKSWNPEVSTINHWRNALITHKQSIVAENRPN